MFLVKSQEYLSDCSLRPGLSLANIPLWDDKTYPVWNSYKNLSKYKKRGLEVLEPVQHSYLVSYF